ncbi:hypothetical protein D3C76_165450 [compost metagenome]
MADKFKTKKCTRCDGTGRVWQHGNVMNGVCFKCKGAGFVYLTKPAQMAYVMTREKVISQKTGETLGYSGWVTIAKGWVSDTATQDEIKSQYVAKGYDVDLLTVTIKTEDRKIPL